jgi:catalase
MHECGKLVLNRNPENFHHRVEQAASSPRSMIPGIEDSPDPLLQLRMFLYRDAQYHRVGVNLHQVPDNCPFMAGSYSSLNFDGPLATMQTIPGIPNMFLTRSSTSFVQILPRPLIWSQITLSRKSHFHHEGKLSDYDQARELYGRVISESQRHNLHHNTKAAVKS